MFNEVCGDSEGRWIVCLDTIWNTRSPHLDVSRIEPFNFGNVVESTVGRYDTNHSQSLHHRQVSQVSRTQPAMMSRERRGKFNVGDV